MWNCSCRTVYCDALKNAGCLQLMARTVMRLWLYLQIKLCLLLCMTFGGKTIFVFFLCSFSYLLQAQKTVMRTMASSCSQCTWFIVAVNRMHAIVRHAGWAYIDLLMGTFWLCVKRYRQRWYLTLFAMWLEFWRSQRVFVLTAKVIKRNHLELLIYYGSTLNDSVIAHCILI